MSAKESEKEEVVVYNFVLFLKNAVKYNPDATNGSQGNPGLLGILMKL